MSRVILHLDMDAFFAAVEQLDNPALRGRPIVVGGDSRRGVVSTASYEARKFGLRSAMPMARVRALCPSVVVVLPRPERYTEVSRQVHRIFADFTPLVEALSIDEAFLDVTASESLFGDGAAIATAIRARIFRETGLTASAGVAACKFVAKLASDMNKPDGLTVVRLEGVAEFLAPLPIERMWGVGEKTALQLRHRGVATFADLVRRHRDVTDILGQRAAVLADLARGIDDRAVEPNGEAKSIGSESTFEEDLTDLETVREALLEHAARVAARLVADGAQARTIHIKLRHADFSLVTRQLTVATPVADTISIGEVASQLLASLPLRGARIRLVGLSVSGFAAAGQMSLFAEPGDERAARRLQLEQTLASVRSKTGADVGYAPRLIQRSRVAPEGDLEHVPRRIPGKR